MADLRTPPDPNATNKLQQLRDRQAYLGWQGRIVAIEVRREEVALELARLEEEEKSLRANVQDHETRYASKGAMK